MTEHHAVQAYLNGEVITTLPHDLYIPPDALEVLLDSFTGPLDLLLYLIKKQNIDITNIPICSITRQYLSYIDAMEAKRMVLAAEYLLMAATLAEIKSRVLLPLSPDASEEEGEDPRLKLVRQLQAYEQMKCAAISLDELPRKDREIFHIQIKPFTKPFIQNHPHIGLNDLMEAMNRLNARKSHQQDHTIHRTQLSVDERIGLLLKKLQSTTMLDFKSCLDASEGRPGVVVTLLAILECAHKARLTINQPTPFGPIYLFQES